MNYLSLCFPEGGILTSCFHKGGGLQQRQYLRLCWKEKEGILENHIQWKLRKSKFFPRYPASPPAAASLSSPNSDMVKERPQSSSCMSMSAVLASSPRQGSLHKSLVRLSQLYAWVPQSRPVRKGRELLRPLSDPQEGHTNWHSLGMGNSFIFQ